MSRVGIYKGSLIKDIYPQDHQDVRDVWNVVMPQMVDDRDCLQINHKYIFSLGAHDTHTLLVLSAKYKMDYVEAIQIEGLISYLFDGLCHLTFPNDKRKSTRYLSGLKTHLRMLGFLTDDKHYTVEHRIAEIHETVSNLIGDGYTRYLPFDLYQDRDRCCSCDLPANKRILRAFAVYRQALFSVEPQGRILNYWRVLESVTNLKTRYQLIRSFLKDTLRPIKCLPIWSPGYPIDKPFNLMQRYKKSVKRYFNTLVKTHGSPDQVLDHLYMQRRNPSVHANRDILEVSHNVSLVSLYKDALLLKYLSRCAIERYWKSL